MNTERAKTEPSMLSQLREGVRKCFPAITRDRLIIQPFTVLRDNNVTTTILWINVGEEIPYYDAESLMSLLGAEEVTGNRHRVVIKGRFQGRVCEIQLVTQPIAKGASTAATAFDV